MAQLLHITPDEYHLRPGFSSSLATTLLNFSPLHAWTQHPLLGGKGKKATKYMNRGTAGHTLVLGKGKQLEVLEFDDFKKKAAQEARDAAEAAGRVPILRHAYDEAQEMADRIIAQLAGRGIVLDGESELAVEWEEPTEHGPVLCRGMFDHAWIDRGVILDLKIVENASDDSITRSAERYGYGVQAHAYQRALAALRPDLAGRTKLLFAFCEPEAPYAINLVEPDGLLRELGARRWHRAVEIWGRCLKENRFPAYGDGVNRLTAPAWALAREEEADALADHQAA